MICEYPTDSDFCAGSAFVCMQNLHMQILLFVQILLLVVDLIVAMMSIRSNSASITSPLENIVNKINSNKNVVNTEINTTCGILSNNDSFHWHPTQIKYLLLEFRYLTLILESIIELSITQLLILESIAESSITSLLYSSLLLELSIRST